MLNLLADVVVHGGGGGISTWGVGSLAIAIVVIVGICVIVGIVLQKLGWSIPDWVIKIFWVLVIVVVAVWAIKFLLSIW